MSEGAQPEHGMRRLYATALELGPLLLFFVANGRWGIFVGTGVFIVATAIALPCYRWLEKRWPVMPLVGGFFVLVFGGLTIWLQDDTFIKLKPTIVNCLFAVILGGGLVLFKKPLLKPLFGAAFRLTAGLSSASKTNSSSKPGRLIARFIGEDFTSVPTVRGKTVSIVRSVADSRAP